MSEPRQPAGTASPIVRAMTRRWADGVRVVKPATAGPLRNIPAELPANDTPAELPAAERRRITWQYLAQEYRTEWEPTKRAQLRGAMDEIERMHVAAARATAESEALN